MVKCFCLCYSALPNILEGVKYFPFMSKGEREEKIEGLEIFWLPLMLKGEALDIMELMVVVDFCWN